jgi:spermidine synthase
MKSKPPAPTEEIRLSAGLRGYLYATATITGAAIMVLEILGAKMLAPYFGTSHFVWTAQIAVTLVALACGYYVGGRWVDRRQDLGQLYAAIVAAALYVAAATLACERVSYFCLRLSLPAGSLLASVTLFFVPLGLLAMVGPFFIRMLTRTLGGVGASAGRLTAISTFGSFVGTVLIGYVLIPFFPNSTTMYGVALLLTILALIYWVAWGGRPKGAAAAAGALGIVAVVAWVGTRPGAWRSGKVEQLAFRNSHFGQLQVIQVRNSGLRFFLNDYLAQDIYDATTHRSAAVFTYLLHELARTHARRTDRVLCIGLGVGIVPAQFAAEGAVVDVVEINPAVVPLAEEYFDLKPGQLKLHFGDGRYFLNRTTNVYDAIILDAFLGDSSPSHLMTREAFSAMRHVLAPEGVLAINTISSLQAGRNFQSASIYKTLTNVFASAEVYSQGGNVFFIASNRPDLSSLHPPDLGQVHPRCLADVRNGLESVSHVDAGQGMILTDDYNPVEVHDAVNREELRRRLAVSMKAL